jgi:hypothetical protein
VEVITIYCKALSQYLHGGIVKNQGKKYESALGPIFEPRFKQIRSGKSTCFYFMLLFLWPYTNISDQMI